jgi:prolipoprotein diacylglyceryl transferase
VTISYMAYFPSPPRGVWYLGPVPIRAYALFIIVGIVVALLIGDRRWAARGGERGVIYDIALWAVPLGLLGGRLYHLCTDWRTYFGAGGAGLNAALRIWDGGLGIWGAVALGGVGAWIGCRRRGISLPAFGDAVAPGIVLAQAIGRLGNYFNQELYGRETTMPWGLEIYYRRDPSGFVDVHSLDGVSTGQLALVVQPTFLYEMLWNLVVFGALLYLDRRFVLDRGRLFATYVAAYCVGRFTIELLRDDAATHIAGIRINSFTSTFVFIGAVVYIILVSRSRADAATGASQVAPVPQPADELAAVASGPVSAGHGSVGAAQRDLPTAETQTLEPAAEAVVAEAEAIEGDVAEAEVLPLEAEPGEDEAVEAPEVAEPAAEADEPEVPVVADADEPEVPVVDEPGTAEPDLDAANILAEAEPAQGEVIDVSEVAEPTGELDEPDPAEAGAVAAEESDGDVDAADMLLEAEPAQGEVIEATEPAAQVDEFDVAVAEEPEAAKVDEPDVAVTEEPEPAEADEPDVAVIEEPEPAEADEPEPIEAEEPAAEEPASDAEAESGDAPPPTAPSENRPAPTQVGDAAQPRSRWWRRRR